MLVFCLALGCVQNVEAAEQRPAYAQEVVRVIHRVRELVEHPANAIPEDISLVRKQVSQLAADKSGIERFTQYLYGEGLLYLDMLAEDLDFLIQAQSDPQRRETAQSKLDELAFPALAHALLKQSMAGLPGVDDRGEVVQQALDRIDIFEKRSIDLFAVEDRFNESAARVKGKLRLFQSILVGVVSGLGVHSAWHFLGLDTFTPRELVGLIFSVWASNEALYWLVWDHFKRMDLVIKRFARAEFEEFRQSWTELLKLNPTLSARKAASAATSKPLSKAKHADAQADAALEAMFDSLKDEDISNDAAIKAQLFNVFLTELEDGNGARAVRILEVLKRADPDSRAARMSAIVARIFAARAKMEWKCLLRQSLKASWRSALLGLTLFGSNYLLKHNLPENLAPWRTVPNWILGGLGLRRIYPLVWRPHRLEALRQETHKEEAELREAFKELMAIDPTGAIVERIAEYDSGVSAHQVVTFAAGDALAEEPNGLNTRVLWKLVAKELAANHPAGSRVRHLLQNTYAAQRSCVMRMLGLVRQAAEPPPLF